MTLSKAWFAEEIARWTIHRETCTNQSDKEQATGIIAGLRIAYAELVKSPNNTAPKKKDIDIEKGYEAILNYYMNNRLFIEKYPDIETRKRVANSIALNKMSEQQTRLSL